MVRADTRSGRAASRWLSSPDSETGRVGIAFYREAGVLVIQSRRPRTGGGDETS